MLCKKYTIHNTRYKFRAQSLLEALLSITLGVILIGGSVGLIGVSLKTFNTAKQHLQANSLMRQTAEVIQSLARDNWHNIYDLIPGIHYKLAKQGNVYAFQKGEEKIFDDTNLVAYWNMDEGSGQIAYDNKNTNNGILTNSPTWKSGSDCVSGSCLEFNGSTNYVNCGNQAGTSLSDPSISGALSVSLWVKINSGYYIMSSGGQTSSRGFAISYQNNAPFISLQDGTKSWIVNPTWNTGRWIHIAFSWDGSSLKYYENGQLTLTDNTGSNATYSDTQTLLTIGRPNNILNYYFNGSIDEVRIYSRALTADEIQTHYRAGLDKLGLVSYWALDENAFITAYDSQSTNNGTLYNIPTWQPPSNCVSGSCLSFDGVNDYVNLNNLNLSNTDKVTVSMWIKFTTSQLKVILEHSTNFNSYNAFLIDCSEYGGVGSLQFSDHTSQGYNIAYTTAGYNDGKWHYFVAVSNRSEDGLNQIKLYVDGVENTIHHSTHRVDLTGNYSTYPLYLASRAGSGYFHQGILDEVRIYNRALSAEEINQRYQGSYTKYFVTNKISRTSGSIDTTYNSANDDPSTLKINSIIKYGRGLVSQQTGGIANVSFYLTRSYNNQVFHQTDWSGGSGQTGPISNPGSKFDTADANINYASTTGQITMITATTTPAELVSSILDTGVSGGAGFNSLLWQGSLGTGGTVKFQIAFSNSSSGPWIYYGPTSQVDYYEFVAPYPMDDDSVAFPTTGSASPQNMRYIRYKVYLSTTGTSPTINDIIINWAP